MRTRSSPSSPPARWKSAVRTPRRWAALAACLLLTGCAEYTLVVATPTPNQQGVFVPPPTGFNHRFGNSPLASKDGFALERALFAQYEFWEVAIRIEPLQDGYPNLADQAKVRAARHAVSSLLLVVATENRATIVGLLAWHTNAGQEQYAIHLLDAVTGLGYDNLQSGEVLIYFTEADEHAELDYTKGKGYKFTVYDNNLEGTGLTPLPGQTPLPLPSTSP